VATRSVTYCSGNRLSCTGCLPANVILCLDSDELLAPITCPETDVDTPFLFNIIEASLISFSKSSGSCSTSIYKYIFEYDDVLLLDPSQPLTSADIIGVFCKGCITNWVEQKIGNESYFRDNGDGTITFISPHGCEYTFSGALIP